MAFTLFGLGKKKRPGAQGPQTEAATTVMGRNKAAKTTEGAAATASSTGKRTGLAKQMQILGSLLLVCMIAMAGLVWRDNRETEYIALYIEEANDIRVLGQQLGKAADQAVNGSSEGFVVLKDAVARARQKLSHLTDGGVLNNLSLPPSPDAVRDDLEELTRVWEKIFRNAGLLIAQEKNFIALKGEITDLASSNSPLLGPLERLGAGRGGRELLAIQQMQVTLQRMTRSAGLIVASTRIDPAAMNTLARDAQSLLDQTKALKGVIGDADGKKGLELIEKLLTADVAAINNLLNNLPKITSAREGAEQAADLGDVASEWASVMTNSYQKQIAERTVYLVGLMILSWLVVGLVALMARTFFTDIRHRSHDADLRSQDADRINRTNQDAILRLMNELGDLADGDLTVTATVSEDITGAIADSINYTIEELRVLVGRINDAANRMTQATEVAKRDSAMLLVAAEKQSKEIQSSGRSILDMSRSMVQVSNHATQSAQVARQSLNAAEKGAGAVQDSIKSMNEIRGQIQETSKRIKRLGESSQEISEIVELISDITEQTNVLALNAAIQAASAGEAGRGFTVVAEEVQRLAERSAEATKQIAAIVKTIQTDTHDAISAMEQSTQGVVEGAKLSDAAGQALNEIGQVSRNLAQLIENISVATTKQAKSAEQVAQNMQGILHITEQTTVGTKKTATLVVELATLASDLKGSVAGFKVS